MTKTVILIEHPVGERIDRASRILAERGFETEWVCPGRGDALPKPASHHVATVVYGGAENLSECEGVDYIRREVDWIERWVALERPLLGFCLGSQMLARGLGAHVGPHPDGHCEVGFYPIHPTEAANGFLADTMHAYQWHKEGFELPEGAVLLAAGSGEFPNQAFRYGRNAYGLQFHPEVDLNVFKRWLDSVPDVHERPGAHGREQQLADAGRHDEPVGRWLETFMDQWLSDID